MMERGLRSRPGPAPRLAELARTPEMTAKLRSVYAVPVIQTPEQMAKANQQDFEISGALIKTANIKLE